MPLQAWPRVSLSLPGPRLGPPTRRIPSHVGRSMYVPVVTWSEQALGQLREALSGMGETGAHVRLRVQWGPMIKDDRTEWMPAGKWISVDADTMNLIVAHWHAGETDAATTVLVQAFLNRYPLPGAEPRDVDVYEVQLKPAPI